MKVMVIGCGFIARTHISAIRSLGHEPVCVIGRNEEKTRAFAEETGVPRWYTSIDRALEEETETGCVHICTPPYQHAGSIRKCLAAGKHIICEKPLSIDPDEARALAEEARAAHDERGIITALNCNVRYYPACRAAAAMIKESGGAIKAVHGSYLQEFHIPPHPDGWRFDAALSGGQRAISEIGTHWIDLVLALTGLRITEVCADLANWYPVRYREGGMLTAGPDGEAVPVGTEDAAAVLLRLEGGGIGALFLSETAPGHPNDLSIEVSDLRQSIRWEEAHPDILQISGSGSMTSKTYPVSDRDETFAALFSDVYAAIGGTDPDAARSAGHAEPSWPTFDDGAYIAAVCSAIKKSGESREWVPVVL